MYLNTHSYYSFCYGTYSIEELVRQANYYGISSLALTDINTTMGIPDFVAECNKYGIKPIAGAEFRNNNELLYVAIAKDNEGFREINEHISRHNIIKMTYEADAPSWNNVYTIYPFGNKNVKQLKDNEYIGIRLSQTARLITSDIRKYQDRVVIMQPVTFKDEDSRHLHKCMRAIDNNMLISRLDPMLHAMPDEILLRPDRINAAFILYKDIVKTSERLVSQCNIYFDFKTAKNKRYYTGNRYDDYELLRKMAFDGMTSRYGNNNKEAYRRIEHELEIIDKLDFASYFLITADIIRYSISKGIPYIGRGSGANSIIAYCLRITDVDPIGLDLYFERFLNSGRSCPPDFDIDYSWKDRDKVTSYIFSRYGRTNTALLGATISFQKRSLLRELGKIYGMPKQEIEKMGSTTCPENNVLWQKIHCLAQRMKDFPYQRSIHAGGVLITEEPITCYTALDMPPKGFQTTQFDMYVAERLHFEKFDILSQRGIGHIQDAVEMIRKNRNIDIDIHNTEKIQKDEKVRQLLRYADTNGCFYIESPAMRGLLKKLQCDSYETLVAASSIIRPGVAKSGMMKEYIKRFHNQNDIKYIHPLIGSLLKETFGVMVYQEDVLKVCHHFAGLDLNDADLLRRMMNNKRHKEEEYDRLRQKFFNNCKSKGYNDDIIKEVWRQIESFAGYSFSKAHSASYAVESMQSLYLKAHFPLEFQVAVINNFGGFYPTWVYFNELKKKGGNIHHLCVNNSHYLTTLYGDIAYIGFIHLQGLEKEFAINICRERGMYGKYLSIKDFIERLHPKIEQIILLIRSNAFAFTGKNKTELLWEAMMFNNKYSQHDINQYRFIYDEKGDDNFRLPVMKSTALKDAYDEIELFGFPLTLSWFDMLKIRFRGDIQACEMMNNIGRECRMLGHLITIKNTRTITGDMMQFATFIDSQGDFFDSVHFPNILKTYPFQGDGTYLILGRITEDFGYPSIEVLKMAKMEMRQAQI